MVRTFAESPGAPVKILIFHSVAFSADRQTPIENKNPWCRVVAGGVSGEKQPGGLKNEIMNTTINAGGVSCSASPSLRGLCLCLAERLPHPPAALFESV